MDTGKVLCLAVIVVYPSFLSTDQKTEFVVRRSFYLKVKSSSYISPRLTVCENLNEYSLTFSCGTDITGLRNTDKGQRNLDTDFMNKYGKEPECFSLSDKLISMIDEKGDVDLERIATNVKELENGSTYTKAQSSIYRAKNTIRDLMESNPWEYFVTITVNPNSPFWKGIDVKDVKAVQYAITNRIRDLNKRRTVKIKYVLIPEYQANGNVHFHGVMSGFTDDDMEIAINMQEFRRDDNGEVMMDENGNKVPNQYYMQPLVRSGNQVFHFKKFNEIGYNDFEIIRDMARVGSYSTKYITKDLFDRANEYGAHLYICSQGLQRKKEIMVRHVDRFRYLTDDEIKAIDENAYIIRTPYSTKVIFNKKHLKRSDELLRFCESIEGETVTSSVDMSSSDMLLAVLDRINESEMETIGIETYDRDTGEVKFTSKNKISFRKLSALRQIQGDRKDEIPLDLFGAFVQQ